MLRAFCSDIGCYFPARPFALPAPSIVCIDLCRQILSVSAQLCGVAPAPGSPLYFGALLFPSDSDFFRTPFTAVSRPSDVSYCLVSWRHFRLHLTCPALLLRCRVFLTYLNYSCPWYIRLVSILQRGFLWFRDATPPPSHPSPFIAPLLSFTWCPR